MITQQNITLNFDAICQEMRNHGMVLPSDKVFIRIPNAKAILLAVMKYFIGQEWERDEDGSLKRKEAKWLPEYDKVVEWLTDNQGRGLFLYGNCGRGKSILCRYAIPAILLKYCSKVVSTFDIQALNQNIDHVLSKHIISLDDIGTEELSVKYGERRMAFAEVMDAAEKNGKLVIVSTNLNLDDLRERYGDRIVDRIKATTKRVLFTGKSLRS